MRYVEFLEVIAPALGITGLVFLFAAFVVYMAGRNGYDSNEEWNKGEFAGTATDEPIILRSLKVYYDIKGREQYISVPFSGTDYQLGQVFMMLAGGIVLEDYLYSLYADSEKVCDFLIDELLRLGIIIQDGKQLSVTRKGKEVSEAIVTEYVSSRYEFENDRQSNNDA